MKHLSSAIGLALGVMATLGLAGPATAQHPIPFHGYLEGDVTRIPVPPVVLVFIDAEGVASSLGRFTLDVPHVLDPSTRTAVGLYQFTASNGDALNADLTGQAYPI